jgi:DNA polymerase-4
VAPCVLHIDMDAFFASVESLRNPRLAGKPVAVGSGVVASASYEARKYGIRAGTPLRKAKELCPALTIVTGHAPIYRCFSERIFSICEEYSPAIETFLDEAYCDWRGTERLYPDPVAVAAEIRRRVRDEVGLTISAGLGRNRMFAKMASKSIKPDGLRRILPGEEEDFLRDLPVSRLPGVGPKTEDLLRKLNIRTVSEMRLLSRESLQAMLGIPGALLHERCRGEDTQPVSEREVPRSIRRETSFHGDTIDREAIEGTLYYLTERAANTMRRQGLEARHIGVKIRYSDSAEESATRKLPQSTQLDSELFEHARGILATIHARRVALRLVGVVLGGFRRDLGVRQALLFETPGGAGAEVMAGEVVSSARRERRLLESLDSIRSRYGYSSVVCGKSLHLLGTVEQDDHGFVLRTSSLTR